MSCVIEPYADWKRQAKALFFMEHTRINDIAIIVRKSRETVSRFLCSCEGYEEEMAFRQKLAQEKRREYKRQWEKDNRRYTGITSESIKAEHIQAVKILSAEQYYG